MDVKTYQALGLDVPWEDLHARGYQVNGRAISDIDESLATVGDVHYHPCPEAQTSGDLEGEIQFLLIFSCWFIFTNNIYSYIFFFFF